MRHLVWRRDPPAAAVPGAAQEKTVPTPRQRQGRRDAARSRSRSPTASRATASSAQAQMHGVAPDEAPGAHHDRASRMRAAAPLRRRPGARPAAADVVAERACTPTSARPSIPPTPNTFVFQYDPGGSELRSLYRYDIASGEASLVTEARRRAITPVWSRQGKWLAYDSAERNGKDRDLYVMQPADPKTKRRLDEVDGPVAARRTGRRTAARSCSPTRCSPTPRPTSGGSTSRPARRRPITPRDGEKAAAWFNARFSQRRQEGLRDQRSRLGGEPRIWRCDVANCAWTPVTPDGVTRRHPNVRSAASRSRRDGSLLAVVVDRGSDTELQVIDLTTMKPRPLPAHRRRASSRRLHWRPDSREIGFTLGSVKAQGDVYRSTCRSAR